MSAFLTSKEARELARQEGWDVYVPSADELTLDIDSPQQMDVFKANLQQLQRHMRADFVWVATVSKSHHPNAGKWHVRMLWPGRALAISEKIALQAALGSDPARELCSLLRYHDNDPEPIILFEARNVVTVQFFNLGLRSIDKAEAAREIERARQHFQQASLATTNVKENH